ncbi:AmmeMemoRadiSam system protein B [bacterium]|nr:AmmeMemoRadiSam system protein B [bacterium]RQV98566.1 MAG: AmmeMemoRadiSam system protein B [bacterium]
MKKHFILLLAGMGFGVFLSFGFCQTNQQTRIRQPAVAGSFYPESKSELTNMIDHFLQNAKDVDISGDIKGIWVPHAGYEFSGQIAANAYRVVQSLSFDAVIVIGPSHYVYLNGGSVGDWDVYQTPLGNAPVDTEMVRAIQSNRSKISSVAEAHRYEHSIEVQIPFIQTVLPGVPIVSIIVGVLSYDEAKDIAKAIVRAVNGKNVLFVASSDMSHFPRYQDAYNVDLRMLDTIRDFDPKDILKVHTSLMQEGVPNLECVLCGPSALMTVMLASKELEADEVEILPYANSGDITGERQRVVGYGAAVFYQKQKETNSGGSQMLDEIQFTNHEKEKLFDIARQSIGHALNGEPLPKFDIQEPNLLIKRGVFVTLMNHGQLRGCIGHFEADYALYDIVSKMAVAAATQDYRFSYNPVTEDEMDQIDVKISILSEMKKIDSVDEIEIGKHGIWIRQGYQSGTYLPEVAIEMGWNRTEFLEHCCVEKAGLPKDAWEKGADIYIYSSQIIGEKSN